MLRNMHITYFNGCSRILPNDPTNFVSRNAIWQLIMYLYKDQFWETQRKPIYGRNNDKFTGTV